MRSVSIENGSGGSSPGCISSAAQSMVVPSSRGGVPVLSRPSAKPSRSSVRESPIAGASPTRPAGVCRSPIWIRPRRNVPVVRTTAPAPNVAAIGQPNAGDAPVRRSADRRPRPRSRSDSRSRGSPAASRRHRACGRPGRAGPRTAGPLRRLSTRNWMPPASATRPIRPSSASISRTRWPLPSPPIAGLQDIAPMVANRCVTSAVRAPMRAAAAAASQPAWPPPITMTSKRASISTLRMRGVFSEGAGQRSKSGACMFHVKHLDWLH